MIKTRCINLSALVVQPYKGRRSKHKITNPCWLAPQKLARARQQQMATNPIQLFIFRVNNHFDQ